MDWVQVLDVSLWPLVTLIGVVIFYQPVSSLLGRISRFSHGNTNVDMTPQSTTGHIETEFENPKTDSGENIYKSSILHNEVEIELSGNEKLKNETNIDTLKYAIQEYMFLLSIERLHRDIYGSQHRAITFAFSNGSRINDQNLMRFYNEARNIYPSQFMNFDYIQWRDFFLRNKLLEIDTTPDNYRLTNQGVAYSKFMKAFTYPTKMY